VGVAESIADRLEEHVRGLLLRGRVRDLPYRVSLRLARGLVTGAISAAAIASAGIAMLLLGLTLPGLAAIAASPLPMIPAAAAYLGYRSRVSARRDEAEDELPFFTALASIIAYCGGTPYMAFKHVRQHGRDVLPGMAAEAEEIERKSTLAGMGVMRAMEAQAESHPNDGFSTFVATSTSVWRSGGDVASTVEDLNSEAMARMEARFDSYADNVGTLVEVMVILLSLMPLGAALSGLANPGLVTLLSLVFGAAVIPATSTALYIAVSKASPRKRDRIEGGAEAMLTGLLIGILATLALQLPRILPIQLPASIPLPTALGIASTAALAYVHVRMRPQVSEVEQSERDLKAFMRVAVEYRKLGLPMAESLKRAARLRYRPAFERLVRRVAARLSMGLPIYRAAADARSWLVRAIFFLLDAADRFGGASPALLERIMSLLGRYSLCRDRAKGSVKLYAYMTYIMPILGAIMIGLIVPFSTAVQITPSALGPGAAAPQLPAMPAPSGELVEAALPMVVIGCLASAFSISRAVNLHPWDVKLPLLVAILSIPSYHVAMEASRLTFLLLPGGVGP